MSEYDYEYRVMHKNINADIEHSLNNMIELGYEFVSIAASDMTVILVMKRKKVIH